MKSDYPHYLGRSVKTSLAHSGTLQSVQQAPQIEAGTWHSHSRIGIWLDRRVQRHRGQRGS